MSAPTIPGVHVFERPSGVTTISGVATSIAAFVGSSTRGPIGQPVRFFDVAGFEAEFGPVGEIPGELGLQVRQFYQNGGGQAWAVRVANGAASAELTLRSEAQADVLQVIARDAGLLGNQIQVDVDYRTASPERTFNLVAYRRNVDPSGTEQITEEEVFENLTMDPDDGRFVETVVNGSSELIQVTSLVDPLALAGAGTSLAGVILETADVDAFDAVHQKLHPTAVPGQNQGSFQIAVDGQRPIVVTAQLTAGGSVGDLQNAFANAIANRLLAEGLAGAVNVTLRNANLPDSINGGRLLDFTSAGGSVRLSVAPSNDITVPLHLGVDQGGIEVDRWSTVRPAPTSMVARLHANPALNDLAQLRTFAGEDKAGLAQWTLTDADGAVTEAIAFPAGPMYENPAFTFAAGENIVGCFRNVAANLSALAAGISGSAAADQSAEVHGLRLVVRGPDRSPIATASLLLASEDGGGGGLQIENTLFAAAENPANVGGYPLGDALGGTFYTNGLPGDDGNNPLPGDYADAYDALERAADIFNILILPRTRVNGTDQTDAERADLWGPASTFCREQRAFLIIDPPSDNGAWSDVNEVTDPNTGVNGVRIGLVSDHSALYWPRVLVSDDAGNDRFIDPAGSLAGLYARTDSRRGVWKAPAGLEATLSSVRGVEHVVTDPENGVTNPAAVDTLRLFTGGVTSWGARTLDGFDGSANTDWRYVPVRRTALFIEESLYRGLQFAVFQPNDEPLWAQIRLAAGSFMNNLFRQGAFQGRKSSDAYFVRCDAKTTTQNDINLGVVNVEVGFAPLRPAEFVLVYVQQMAGQLQV